MKLQKFATNEAVQGKQLIYLYRLYEEASQNAATHLAFTTENETSISKDADSTATKDGSLRTPGTAEVEITATSILVKGDEMVKKLKDAMINDKLVEIWEVNLAEPGTGANKFKGTYYQGYCTECSKSSPSDDFVEVSLTFGINGAGADGEVTVTKEQQEAAAYTFKDATAGA